MNRTTQWASAAVTAAMLTTSLTVLEASAVDCAPPAPGGEWGSFGADDFNTRHQTEEDTITPGTAYAITPQWSYDLASEGATGGFQSASVVKGGCIYLGTNTGWVVALNADTGEEKWATKVEAEGLIGTLSGGIFTVGVDEERVYANVSVNDAPFMQAFDRDTGDKLWATIVHQEEGSGAYTNSSVAIIDGDMIFIGISGPENTEPDQRHPGGFALVDAETGTIVTRQYTVSEEDDARGLKGVSMWATPVWDAETGYMYNGTGQPANKDRESSLSNAIVKVDVARERDENGNPVPYDGPVKDWTKGETYPNPNFGEIVDSFHGNWDEGLDVDFGGSPSMWTDADGHKIVGAIQKSGTFYAVFADNMEQAWWRRLADPSALGSSTDAAVDENNVYIGASYSTNSRNAAFGTDNRDPEVHAGALYALDRNTGEVQWRFPISGLIDYHPMAVGGGVVWYVSNHGFLLGLSAETGNVVSLRSMHVDAPDACVNLSGGVTIARNTIYAPCDTGVEGGGWIVAYRLPADVTPLPLD